MKTHQSPVCIQSPSTAQRVPCGAGLISSPPSPRTLPVLQPKPILPSHTLSFQSKYPTYPTTSHTTILPQWLQILLSSPASAISPPASTPAGSRTAAPAAPSTSPTYPCAPASSLAGHEHYGTLYGVTYYNFKFATGEPYRAGPLAAEEKLEEWLAKALLTYCTCDDVVIAFWTSLEKKLRSILCVWWAFASWSECVILNFVFYSR
jgi:hypothetical protein